MSLTLNSDLYARSRSLGINASQVAERALADELARRTREALVAEIRQDLEAINTYTRTHGSFAELMREEFGDPWDGGADAAS